MLSALKISNNLRQDLLKIANNAKALIQLIHENLANFKIAVKTREYLIQAIFQMLFDDQKSVKIIKQFKRSIKQKKDFKMFSSSKKSIEKNKQRLKMLFHHLIKKSSMELIDKSILYFCN